MQIMTFHYDYNNPPLNLIKTRSTCKLSLNTVMIWEHLQWNPCLRKTSVAESCQRFENNTPSRAEVCSYDFLSNYAMLDNIYIISGVFFVFLKIN